MLDAMVQLLTGSNDGFNETYFEELVQCMDDYDLNLYTSQVRKYRHRDTHKGWEFRDDCTEFFLQFLHF